MTSREPVREQLLGPEQMGQIGPREAPAGEARTVRPGSAPDRRGSAALRMFSRPPGTHSWPFRATRAGSTESNRSTPAVDRLEQVRRRAEAHQVARPRIVGQQRDGDVERRVALRRRLVAGQPADADAVERQRRDEPGRCAPAGPARGRPGRSRTAPGPARVWAASERSAQRWVRSVASATTARGELG